MIASEHLVDVGGRRLYGRHCGSGSPTVVLVAGGGMTGLFLQPLQARVSDFARAWTYDRAGLGGSDAALLPMGFGDHARDLHSLLEAVGEEPPYVLVGESFGGLVVRAFAAAYPRAVAGIVLVDSAEEAHVFGRLTVLHAAGRRQLRIARGLAAVGLMRPLVHLGLPRAFEPAVRAALADRLADPGHWQAAAAEMAAYDLTPADARRAGGFGALGATPLTVIAHDRPFGGALAPLEPGWREAQGRLAALSTAGRLIVAKGCGHAIAQTAPGFVAAQIRDLLSPAALQPHSSGCT